MNLKTADVLGRVRARIWAPLAAIGGALLCSGLFLAAVGVDPITAFGAMVEGSVGGVDALAVTGVRMTPLLIAGLGVTLSFRAGVFNIGGEGQLYLGAVGATLVGVAPLPVPAWLHVLLALTGAFAGGALWALIPGYFRAYRGVSEVVLTLMLNYVGIELASYLVDSEAGPLGERGASYSQSMPVEMTARLPTLIAGTSLHGGLILALALAGIVHLLLHYSPFGFRLRMVGANADAARYAGIRPARQILWAMLLSGGLAGLAGGSEVLGLRYRLYDHFSPGYGFDAIAVALLAQLNPLATILSAGFFGALRAGANQMQQTVGVEVSIIIIVQAFAVLFVMLAGTLGARGRPEGVALGPAGAESRAG